jgi:hypothetical protein
MAPRKPAQLKAPALKKFDGRPRATMMITASSIAPPKSRVAHRFTAWIMSYPNTVMSRLPTAQMTIPQSVLTPWISTLIDCPPRMRFEAKKPTYMNTAMAITRTAPTNPNWPRLWIICGTPSRGPCAECRAMNKAPTRLPSRIASTL